MNFSFLKKKPAAFIAFLLLIAFIGFTYFLYLNKNPQYNWNNQISLPEVGLNSQTAYLIQKNPPPTDISIFDNVRFYSTDSSLLSGFNWTSLDQNQINWLKKYETIIAGLKGAHNLQNIPIYFVFTTKPPIWNENQEDGIELLIAKRDQGYLTPNTKYLNDLPEKDGFLGIGIRKENINGQVTRFTTGDQDLSRAYIFIYYPEELLLTQEKERNSRRLSLIAASALHYLYDSYAETRTSLPSSMNELDNLDLSEELLPDIQSTIFNYEIN